MTECDCPATPYIIATLRTRDGNPGPPFLFAFSVQRGPEVGRSRAGRVLEAARIRPTSRASMDESDPSGGVTRDSAYCAAYERCAVSRRTAGPRGTA